MSGLVTSSSRRVGTLIHELRSTRDQVARLAAADAVTEERLRFARDLHDLLGHSLSVIALKAELARRLLEREVGDASPAGDGKGSSSCAEAWAEVRDVEQIAREALEEVREAVTGYRARSLADEITSAGRSLETAGITASVHGLGESLPPETEVLLAWVAREALTNVIRHSRARRVEIELRPAAGEAILEIHDDGTGSVNPVTGSGLSGLGERIRAAGGRFEAGPGPEGGFRVLAAVPLEPMRATTKKASPT
jgi:two-component system sensor histidine kinase DesK